AISSSGKPRKVHSDPASFVFAERLARCSAPTLFLEIPNIRAPRCFAGMIVAGSMPRGGDPPYEPDIESCGFGNLRRADVCAGSTVGRGQVEGGCTKCRQNHQRRQAQDPDLL